MKMQKYGKLFKKAALTAAICLGLSQSVWAMPSGGAVDAAGGSVTIDKGSLASPSSGATIATVSGSAIINWDAFGLLSGEALSFNTANGALLNRVTGGNISEIFGTLTQTGGNPMFLVNPAGILVGSTGVIDANTLTLSTLAMDNNQFALAANGIVSFGDGSNPGPLTIEKGAEFNANNLLAALGGTVEVADGVTFSVGNDLVLTAANNVTALVDDAAKNHDYTIGTKNFYPIGISATSENKLSVGKDTIKTNDLAFLAGGSVDITGANIESDAVQILSAASGETQESNRVQNGADVVYTSGADNAITVTGASLQSTDDLDIRGGTVTINNSALSGSGIDVVSAEKTTAFDDGDAGISPQSADYALTLKNTTVIDTDGSDIFMGGGAVTLDGATLNSKADIRLVADTANDHTGTNHIVTTSEGNTVTIKNSSDIQAVGLVTLAGHSVSVTDSTLSGRKVQLAAAKFFTLEDENSVSSMAMTPGNEIKADNMTIEDVKTASIIGGKVDLKNSAITAKGENGDAASFSGHDLVIFAGTSVGPHDEEHDALEVLEAEAGNTVTLTNTSVTVEPLATSDQVIDIAGGKVTLDGATLKGIGDGKHSVDVRAVTKSEGNWDDGLTYTATPENTVEIKGGSELSSKSSVINGGEVSVTEASTVSASTPDKMLVFGGDSVTLTYGAATVGKAGTTLVSKDSKLVNNGVDVTDKFATTRGDEPQPQPEPEPKFDEDVQKNIDNGAEKMGKVLTDNNTPETRQKATQELVGSINQAAATDTQKAAQITGVMKAIREDESLSDAEKIALQNEVVSEFEPTKQAKAEADNTVTSAVQEASTTTVNETAVTAATQPSTASEESPVTGV